MNDGQAGGFLTAKEVATLKKVTVRSVHRALKEGRLKGVRLGGRWVTDHPSVREWMPTGRFIPSQSDGK